MAKIPRKYMAHFINAAESDDVSYIRLGDDLEEYNVEMSAQVDNKQNILGEKAVVISGYEKSGDVATYYADADSILFARLQSIIDQELTLDDLKTTVVEVKLWDQVQDNVYNAVCEEAFIEVVSYGGDTTGYQIPFKLHYTGAKRYGTFDLATAVFTET